MVHGEGEKEYIELILTVRSKKKTGEERKNPETIRSKHDPIYTHDSTLPWFFLAIFSSPSIHANQVNYSNSVATYGNSPDSWP